MEYNYSNFIRSGVNENVYMLVPCQIPISYNYLANEINSYLY